MFIRAIVHVATSFSWPKTASPVGRFIGHLDEKRPGAAGRVVHGAIPPADRADPDHLGHDAGDFRRGVELSLAFSGLGRELAQEAFVRVAQEVVAMGAVGPEIESLKIPTSFEKRSCILLAPAELALVVEIGLVDHPLEEVVVGVAEPGSPELTTRETTEIDSLDDQTNSGPVEPRYRQSRQTFESAW